MIDLFKEIDFSKEIEEAKVEKAFLIDAAKKIQAQQSEIIRKIKRPEVDEELLNHFIIFGIPVVTAQKQEAFKLMFKTKLLDSRKIGEKNGLERMDLGKENGIGNKTVYMVYKTPAQAKVALNKLNNLKFSKEDTLSCFTIKEVEDILEFKDEKIEPTAISESEKVQHNFDQEHRSQFIVRQGNNIILNWLDHLDKSSPNALQTEFLTNDHPTNKVIFSPLGSYLAACTKIGTFLFSGSKMRLIGFYKQDNPIDAKFSPNQKFLITFNGSNMIKDRQNFIIWGVRQQIKLKSYRAHSHQNLDSFQFSDNSQNLAIVLNNQVRFYKTQTVQKFKDELKLQEDDGNTLKAPHIQKIAWLKTNVSIICVCYEIDYNPVNVAATRVFLYNVQTKEQRKWRAWSEHTKNGEIVVSEKGDWVAISLRKFIKKNHFATVIQIGNLIKKEEPLQVTSVQIREEIGNISWDWNNNRFAIVHEDEATKKGINVRYVVQFYQISIKNRNIEIIKMHQIRNNLQNRVILTKNGSFFSLYNISEDSPEKGKVSFGIINKEAAKDSKDKGKRISFDFIKQNIMINGMCFFNVDPTGRFILLGTEKTFQVWNFIGEIVTKDTLQKHIHDVIWRPRLQNYLSQKEEKALIEQEKQIRKKYEEIDDRRINSLKYQKEESKKKQKEEFLEYITSKRRWYREYAQLREKIIGFNQSLARTETYEINESIIELE